jgi:hypothetical protein
LLPPAPGRRKTCPLQLSAPRVPQRRAAPP